MSVPSAQEHGRWALAGLSPAGRFLLERWSLRKDFPLAAVFDADAADAWRRAGGLCRIESWTRLLAEDEISGVILTVPLERRAAAIKELLSAGKDVLVEGSPAATVAECSDLERTLSVCGRPLGVFYLRRADLDDAAAHAGIATGRLGELRTVRWIACECALPAGERFAAIRPDWEATLSRTGPWLFDQLSQLTSEPPQTVQGWAMPATAGFQARLDYAAGLVAWIEVHSAALSNWRTGWIIEGSQGAYREQRLLTLADDGELLEEDVRGDADADEDVLADLKRLAGDAEAARQSYRRAFTTRAMLAAIVESIRLRRPVGRRELEEPSPSEAAQPAGTVA